MQVSAAVQVAAAVQAAAAAAVQVAAAAVQAAASAVQVAAAKPWRQHFGRVSPSQTEGQRGWEEAFLSMTDRLHL